MKTGKTLGLIGGLSGIAIGSYYSFTAIEQSLSLSILSAHQAGTYSAISATIVGVSLAAIGAIYNHSRNNT
ncbi:hypothetical protein [Vibrio mexicanus]|uniref:hypothetical protein n=1 Tax=Vibrio mexicanus TaxID=1004326 RepID=UPI00063C901C|nr:hypothetical protein [Vibrio mexicanus]